MKKNLDEIISQLNDLRKNMELIYDDLYVLNKKGLIEILNETIDFLEETKKALTALPELRQEMDNLQKAYDTLKQKSEKHK